MFSVSLAILSQEFHGRERGTAFGIWGATIGLAVAIGPLVGGLLTEYAGWRWIFFVNLPIGAICVLGALAYLHESRDEQHRGFDALGFVLLTGGLFALVLALLRGSDWGWGSGRTIGLFVAAVVLLTAFVVSQLNKSEAMFDMTLFRKPAFAGAQIIAFTISPAMFALFLYLTLYLQNQLHLSPLQAGLRFLPLSLALVRHRADRGTTVRRACPCASSSASACRSIGVALLLMHGITPSSTWTHLLPGFIVGGIGIGVVNAPLASTAVSVVEPRRAGMASGINNTFRQVGIATGVAGLGAIFQSKHTLIDGLNEILLVAAFVAFAGAILGLALVRDARLRQTTGAGRRGLKRIASCHAASIIITAAPVTTISA